jgi:hypothetical protein
MMECNIINVELRARGSDTERNRVLLPPARGRVKRKIFRSLFHGLKVTAREISRRLVCKYFG